MSEGRKEILLGDCLELMKDIPNGSIDMILCDLPYGTTACKWDVIIPFEPLWEQYERIIKDDGAIVLTASQPFTSALVMSNIKLFKYELIWYKSMPSGLSTANKRPMKYHENICVFYKKQPIYNKIYAERNHSSRINNFVNKNYINSENAQQTNRTTNVKVVQMKRYYEKDKVNPKSVLEIPSVANRKGAKLHPTQKPVFLFEYLINTFTNDGETVLDNCAGSGTTAIACLKTNRQFIVMEKEQKYYDIILKRVGDFNKKFELGTLFGNEM